MVHYSLLFVMIFVLMPSITLQFLSVSSDLLFVKRFHINPNHVCYNFSIGFYPAENCCKSMCAKFDPNFTQISLSTIYNREDVICKSHRHQSVLQCFCWNGNEKKKIGGICYDYYPDANNNTKGNILVVDFNSSFRFDFQNHEVTVRPPIYYANLKQKSIIDPNHLCAKVNPEKHEYELHDAQDNCCKQVCAAVNINYNLKYVSAFTADSMEEMHKTCRGNDSHKVIGRYMFRCEYLIPEPTYVCGAVCYDQDDKYVWSKHYLDLNTTYQTEVDSDDIIDHDDQDYIDYDDQDYIDFALKSSDDSHSTDLGELADKVSDDGDNIALKSDDSQNSLHLTTQHQFDVASDDFRRNFVVKSNYSHFNLYFIVCVFVLMYVDLLHFPF